MSTDLTRLDLALRRRGILGYALGMAAYALVIVALYPSFKDETSLNDFTKNGSKLAALFGASGPLTTPPGWLNANLYANFLPLVVLLLTIGYGASAIAGQDEDGTLGLVATLPVSRRTVVGQKFLAMCLLAVPVSLVTFLCVLAGRWFDLSVGLGNLVGITLGAYLLGVVFGALALLLGILGSRAMALGVTSAVAAIAYLINSLAPVVQWLRPARFGTPFYYAVGDGQLVNGLGFGAVLALLALAVVLLLGSLLAVKRRDIR